jgi:hypothetical protein
MLTSWIVTLLELLETSTVCGELAVPAVTLPKLRLLGLNFSRAFPADCAKAGAGAASPIAIRNATVRTENPAM